MSTVILNNIKCEVNKREYPRTNQIALQLIAAENQVVELNGMDSEVFAGEPICMATVAVPSADIGDSEAIIKSYENPQVLDVLSKAGLVKDTGKFVQVGFEQCPVVHVNMG